MGTTLLSVITINLNNKSGLEKTVKSVTGQTFRDFEYIIIDGGSDDGSLDIIKENENHITYWLSEEDKGIYNAMNKGILKATGEYCLFINSGDIFIGPSTLEQMVSYIMGEDILYGNGFYEAKDSLLEKLECPAKLTLGFFALYSLFHPATLIKRNLFEKYGLYNESNKIVSDFEFFIKVIIINKVKTRLIPLDIAIAEDNGVSRRKDYSIILQQERSRVLDGFFPEYVREIIEEHKSLKIEKIKLTYDNSRLSSEIKIYKGNLICRAIMKMKRIANSFYKKSNII